MGISAKVYEVLTFGNEIQKAKAMEFVMALIRETKLETMNAYQIETMAAVMKISLDFPMLDSFELDLLDVPTCSLEVGKVI